jgi:hypothetical protein
MGKIKIEKENGKRRTLNKERLKKKREKYRDINLGKIKW